MMRTARISLALLLAATSLTFAAQAAPASDAAVCPSGGTLRFGILPAEDTLIMTNVYGPLSRNLARELGCPVELAVTTSYTSAIEAMRSRKLDLVGFGPLSYVLAHRVANAEAIAVQGDAAGKPVTYRASIVTLKGSGIATLRDVAGHSFAFSDPASTSGHLLPSFALKAAGIDPQVGIRPFFAGNHTASFEALRNHKVDAAELNSGVLRVLNATGEYDPAAYVTLWRSRPILGSPLAVRADMSPILKQRLRAALFRLDFRTIDDSKRVFTGQRYVAVDDAAYNEIRTMVAVLHVDLEHIDE